MIFILAKIVWGLAVFILGMALMKFSLQLLAGGKLKYFLRNLTSNIFFSILTGAFITVIIQSSSATLAVLIGLINAQIIPFSHALGVIFGANIGTTITIQILSLNLSDYLLHMNITAIVLISYGIIFKKPTVRYAGWAFLGFFLVFYGIEYMSRSVILLENKEFFLLALSEISEHKLLGFLSGIIMTGVTQSSSAVTGLVLTLLNDSLLTIYSSIPIVLGCNVGTCITSFIASIGGNLDSRKTAAAHFLFNIFGSLIFILLLSPFINIVILTASAPKRQLANAHTMFNIINTLIMIPLIPLLIYSTNNLVNLFYRNYRKKE